MTDLIVLKLKEEEAFSVNAELLTTNSPVFDQLINEFHQTVLELDDFDVEVVTIFITSLESKTLGDIDLSQFRELHKISVVFKVEWMTSQCRKHLIDLINDIEKKEKDEVLLLFEEARFVKEKWGASRYINLLLYNMQASRDNACFITRYMDNLANLSEGQLQLMIDLAGSNVSLLLAIIKQNMEKSKTFDKSSRYLMEHLNLAVVLDKDNSIFHETFETLVAMEQTPHEDTKLILKWHTEATRQYFSNREKTAPTRDLINLRGPWRWDLSQLVELDIEHFMDQMIEKAAANSSPRFMLYVLVDTLPYIALNKAAALRDPTAVVRRLEKECQERGWKRINSRHLDNMRGRIEESIKNTKLRECLEEIRDSWVLASYIDSVECKPFSFKRQNARRPPIGVADVTMREGTVLDSWVLSSYIDSVEFVNKLFSFKRQEVTTLVRYNNFLVDEFLFCFKFKHPYVMECTKLGECGFVLKKTNEKAGKIKLELCTEESEYPPDVHYHDIVSAEDMIPYLILVHHGPANSRLTYSLPLWYNWGYDRFHNWWAVNDQDEVQQLCVYYDVSRHLAGKPR